MNTSIPPNARALFMKTLIDVYKGPTMRTKVKTKKKKENRGGKRVGAGPKPKYNEDTTTIAFRVPVSRVDEITEWVKSKLEGWATKKE